ncbi:MAG: TonB-dependent receptor [Flavobacteriales bacterium]|nr:TonB-dependent receptor [Flavobacteriales bacterium]
MERVVLSSKQKALRINLDKKIYGTFAEIGAGQECVRHFFRVGGASGTIAKAMSAYDKEFSDAIYGPEEYNRYVCRSRVDKMLDHEYSLIIERLNAERQDNTKFFAFANTIATIDFKKRFQGHGWIGIQFQSKPRREPNRVILHIKPLEHEAQFQQETIGILGVNLIYASFFYHENVEEFLESLMDNISRDKIEIDTIEMTGPDFEHIDNRLLSLKLVKNGLTSAVIFSPDGINIHPSDLLYKKNILAIRGSFRPVTKVNLDMIVNGYNAFIKDPKVDKDNMQVLFEITLNNLLSEGGVDEQDFLDRADILCSLGQTVMISNYMKYYKLTEYLSSFTKKRMGFILGVDHLMAIFNEKYYRNLNGGMLEAFGIIATRDVKFFLYPYKDPKTGKLITSKTVKIHPRVRPLYDYLTFNKRIIDMDTYDETVLGIFSKEVLKMIRRGEEGWEEMVPTYVDIIIKKNKLFGYKPKKEDKESAQVS